MANTGRHTATLVAVDEDGHHHRIRTSAQYSWAGLVKRPDGTWTLVTKGWSQASVFTRAAARSYPAAGMSVATVPLVPLERVLPETATRYFAAHHRDAARHGRPTIVSRHHRTTGWETVAEPPPATTAGLRELARAGHTAVTIKAGGYAADFTTAELGL